VVEGLSGVLVAFWSGWATGMSWALMSPCHVGLWVGGRGDTLECAMRLKHPESGDGPVLVAVFDGGPKRPASYVRAAVPCKRRRGGSVLGWREVRVCPGYSEDDAVECCSTKWVCYVYTRDVLSSDGEQSRCDRVAGRCSHPPEWPRQALQLSQEAEEAFQRVCRDV